MHAEPTEMAGVAEAETEGAYAWALDYDDVDEFPTQRLTPRRITALSLAVSLVLIAVAGAVALFVFRHDIDQLVAQAPSTSVVQASPPSSVTVTLPPSVTVTVQAAPLPTYDPEPGDPDWSTDPRFNYGSALPHDSRFSYDVVPGVPCGNLTKEFGFTTEASGGGAIATCNHDTWTWILVGQDSLQFDGTHSHGSRCDGRGAAMSLDGRHMTCVTGANGIGTWQSG
jgi:hypothetical protein